MKYDLLKCIYCHADVFPDDKFCHNCGARIKGKDVFPNLIDERYVYYEGNPPHKPTPKKVMIAKVRKIVGRHH